MDALDLRDKTAHQGWMDAQELMADLAHLEIKGILVGLESEDRGASPGEEETQEGLGPQGWMEHLDPRGEMEPQGMMGDLEQMADLETRGLKEAVVHLENLEYLAREDFLDQKAHEGKRGTLEPQDKMEHLDWTGDLASLD